jgi:hypothetical protein
LASHTGDLFVTHVNIVLDPISFSTLPVRQDGPQGGTETTRLRPMLCRAPARHKDREETNSLYTVQISLKEHHHKTMKICDNLKF